MRRIGTGDQDLCWKVPAGLPGAGQDVFTRLDDFYWEFQGFAGDRLKWAGNIALRHRGMGGRLVTATSDAVAWCIKGSIRQAADPSQFPAWPSSAVDYPYYCTAPWLQQSKQAENIASFSDHYDTARPVGECILPADAWYRVEWWGQSSSQNWPTGTNGLIEIKVNAGDPPATTRGDPYSWMNYELTPVGALQVGSDEWAW